MSNNIQLTICVIIVCILFEIKNENTYRQMRRIGQGIRMYNMSRIEDGTYSYKESLEMYLSVKPYWMALINVFYWGYRKLIPEDVYEKIKDYV